METKRHSGIIHLPCTHIYNKPNGRNLSGTHTVDLT